VRRPFLRALGLAAVWLLLAPTPGDVGGCGQTARDLDAVAFFASKQAIECSKCGECGLSTPACERACNREEIPEEFPVGCYPLVHDGTVCLRALTQASCAVARQVVADPPSVPSECNFCPL
jgi:hypothetical protein